MIKTSAPVRRSSERHHYATGRVYDLTLPISREMPGERIEFPGGEVDGGGMKTKNILVLVMGMAGLGAGINTATSQSDIETPSSKGPSQGPNRDAITEAQTPRQVPVTRPEQRKNEHDRSNIFAADRMQSLLPRLSITNPIREKSLGFDFSRDPFNAKKPMQTFEETMKADIADRPKVMRTQRELLMRRYDLTPRLDKEAKMSRGKPLAVGPPRGSAGGLSWEKLASHVS